MVATPKANRLLDEPLVELLFQEVNEAVTPPQRVAVDISTALDSGGELTFEFLKPSGALLRVTAALSSGGVDGLARYKMLAGQLNEIGQWSVQGVVDLPGATATDGRFHSEIATFEVEANIRPPGLILTPQPVIVRLYNIAVTVT